MNNETKPFKKLSIKQGKTVVKLLAYINENYPNILNVHSKEGEKNINEIDKILNG